MVARRTNAQLEAENARLTAELSALRAFVFNFDLSRENANLQAQRATLQRLLAQQPEPYIPLKKIDAGTYAPFTVWGWARRGLIDAELRGKRWYCRQSSVTAYIQRLKGR